MSGQCCPHGQQANFTTKVVEELWEDLHFKVVLEGSAAPKEPAANAKPDHLKLVKDEGTTAAKSKRAQPPPERHRRSATMHKVATTLSGGH